MSLKRTREENIVEEFFGHPHFGSYLTNYNKHQKTSHSTTSAPVHPPKLALATRSKTMNKRKKNDDPKKGYKKQYIPRSVQPRKKMIRVKASNYWTIANTSGAMSQITCSGNSIYNPFHSGSTQQPLGFDQWAALYNYGTVVGSKVHVTIHNGSSSAIVYGIYPAQVAQQDTNLGNYEYYRELQGTKSRLLSPDMDHGYLSNTVSVKKHLSIKNPMDDDLIRTRLAGTPSDPTNEFFWHIFVQPADQASTTSGIDVIVEVEYLVILHDPIIPSRSTQ